MRKLAALLCSAALVACEPVSAPEVDVPDPSFGKGRVIQSVTGSGHFIFQGNNRTFSFTARRHADGTVSGQWQRVNHIGNASQTKAHGRVTCFTILGNQAILGGFATSGAFSAAPNNEVGWQVEDNGQGANSPADRIGAQFVLLAPGDAASICNQTFFFPLPALTNVLQGNIQVRP